MVKAVKQRQQTRKRLNKAGRGQCKDAIEQKLAKSQEQSGSFVSKNIKVIVVIFVLLLAAGILTMRKRNYDIAETNETNDINMKPKNIRAPNPPINQKGMKIPKLLYVATSNCVSLERALMLGANVLSHWLRV